MFCKIRIPAVVQLLLALIIPLVACNKAAEKPSAKAFASPDDAGSALLEAAKSGDQNALTAIFGPGSKDLISSGDAVQDKAAVDGFVAAYPVMHRWRKMPISVGHSPMLRPSTSPRDTMTEARNSTLSSSSVTPVKRTVCTGNRRKVKPKAHSGRWLHLRQMKDTK
jgi:hypothetical protein